MYEDSVGHFTFTGASATRQGQSEVDRESTLERPESPNVLRPDLLMPSRVESGTSPMITVQEQIKQDAVDITTIRKNMKQVLQLLKSDSQAAQVPDLPLIIEGQSTGERKQPVVNKATHVTWRPSNVSKVIFSSPSGKISNVFREKINKTAVKSNNVTDMTINSSSKMKQIRNSVLYHQPLHKKEPKLLFNKNSITQVNFQSRPVKKQSSMNQ